MRKHNANSKFDDFDNFDDFAGAARRGAARRGPTRRKPRFDDEPEPERNGRLTEGERVRLARVREDAAIEEAIPGGGDRWSTWADSQHGPLPYPDWVVTDLGAVDTELGILKAGKEADVSLIRRGLPGDAAQTVLAAKRYRAGEHRLFHRDAGYLEGRRMRRSREMRAIQSRTAFGRNLIAEQWAAAELAALSRLWTLGAPVPYPVQRDGTEILLEFLGDTDDVAAPRLAQLRPDAHALRALCHQVVSALELLAIEGLTHGDLSAYNILVHGEQIVLIDLPQVVDIVSNPQGAEFLARDVRNIAGWFAARGVSDDVLDTEQLLDQLCHAAGLR